MKLEIGMYVRTPYGIRKIVNITKDAGYKPRVKVIEFDRLLNTTYKMDYIFYTDEHTIKKSKASHNIIDLIEVGDYVNRKLVIDIKTDYIFDYSEEVKIIYFSENDYIYSIAEIKSIVTKEQFESMSYKVGE